MNVARNLRFVTTAMGVLAMAPLLSSPRLWAQQPAAAAQSAVARLVAEPARITIRAGESQPYKITAYDAQGKEIPNAVVRVDAKEAGFWLDKAKMD